MVCAVRPSERKPDLIGTPRRVAGARDNRAALVRTSTTTSPSLARRPHRLRPCSANRERIPGRQAELFLAICSSNLWLSGGGIRAETRLGPAGRAYCGGTLARRANNALTCGNRAAPPEAASSARVANSDRKRDRRWWPASPGARVPTGLDCVDRSKRVGRKKGLGLATLGALRVSHRLVSHVGRVEG